MPDKNRMNVWEFLDENWIWIVIGIILIIGAIKN